MRAFLADLVGTVYGPWRALRRVAGRRRPAEAAVALVLVTALLVILDAYVRGEVLSDPMRWEGLFQRWLRVTAVGLALWLFFAHLLWRVGWVFGGRGSFRAVCAATGMAFAVGGGLTALGAGRAPWLASVPLGLWFWWMVVVAVRWGHQLSLARAAATTLVISALAWACYAAALPWRFDALGIDLWLRLWSVEAPGEHFLLPHLAVLVTLVLLAAGMTLVAVSRRRERLMGGAVIAAAGLAGLILAGWFVAYLDGFLHTPLYQPHAVQVTDDGGLLIEGVGGSMRLASDGGVAWHRPEAVDGALAGPAGQALLLAGAEGQVLLVGADGEVSRVLTMPPEIPFAWASRLGDVAGDRQGHLFLLAGEPARLYRVALGSDQAAATIITQADEPFTNGHGGPMSLAFGADGRLYLADRQGAGFHRVLRVKGDGQGAEVTCEEFVGGDERWRLVAGLDGEMYVGRTRLVAGRPVRWAVERLTPEGVLAAAFVKTRGEPGFTEAASPAFAVDQAGRVYVPDPGYFRLLVLDGQGRLAHFIPAETWYHRLAGWLVERQRAS